MLLLWNRWLTGCVAVLLLGLVAGAAHATSTNGCGGPGGVDDPFGLGVVTSGNGELVFSEFRFHSPSCSVDPADLTIDILPDGVEIAGPITMTDHDWAKFYVSYKVTAVNGFIEGASLALDSSIDAPNGVILATKRLIGGRPEQPNGRSSNHHGWGHLGLGLLKDIESPEPPHGEALAFLKTAQWEVDRGSFCSDPGWDWLCEGEKLFDEESFALQESLKVIDGAWIKALEKQSSVTFVSSTNHFTVTPEPAAGTLMLLGLLGLAIGRHRL